MRHPLCVVTNTGTGVKAGASSWGSQGHTASRHAVTDRPASTQRDREKRELGRRAVTHGHTKLCTGRTARGGHPS